MRNRAVQCNIMHGWEICNQCKTRTGKQIASSNVTEIYNRSKTLEKIKPVQGASKQVAGVESKKRHLTCAKREAKYAGHQRQIRQNI